MVPTTGDDGWEDGDDDDVERDKVGDERIGNGDGETADIAIASSNHSLFWICAHSYIHPRALV